MTVLDPRLPTAAVDQDSDADDQPVDSIILPDYPIHSSLTDNLLNGVTLLRETFGKELNDPDAASLLESLESTEGHVVRQPPLAAQRVLAVARQPNATLDSLVDLLERDPTLVQGLLRYANSAFYGGLSDEPVVSLMTAVQRVGMSGVEAVVMQSIAEGLISRPGPPFDRFVGKVWSHMVRCAPIARGISSAFGVEQDRAFTLGLLHDAGKLVILDRVSAIRSKRRKALKIDLELLSAMLTDLHQSVGGLAALEWGLGDDSVAAIAIHHRSPPPDSDMPLSEVILVAERIDLAKQKGERPDLAQLWNIGKLSGSLEKVQEIIDSEDALAA